VASGVLSLVSFTRTNIQTGRYGVKGKIKKFALRSFLTFSGNHEGRSTPGKI